MNILMLSTSYPKYPGETTAPFIEEIAAGLAAQGHTIHLVLPWHPDIRRDRIERGVHLHFYKYAPHPALNIWGYAQSLHADTDIKFQTIGTAPLALAASTRALLRVMHQQMQAHQPPFELVHAHWVLPNAPPAALVAWSVRLPLVVSLHGNDIYMAERFPATTPAAGLAFRAAAAVTACSRDLFTRGVQLGAPPDRSYIIPYGIHLDEFRPGADAAARVRAALGLPATAPLVVGVGRLVRKKGFGVLIDAWPQVLRCHPDAALVLVGYGDLREQLEHQAQRLGVAHHVHFTGQVARDQVPDYVAAADVFALPIVPNQGTDGLPNVLLEAMSAGCPIVASRVAGVPDVIEDGQQGVIVPDSDPTALATAINRLLDDRVFAARLGTAARERVAHDLTWQHTADKFATVYRNVLQARLVR
jgi:glycosyltransferase involved in cell wall biosynthesis